MASSGSYHLLHIFPSFEVGGVQVRTTGIINALDRRFQHSIIALNSDYDCADRLAGDAQVNLLTKVKPPSSLPGAWACASHVVADVKPDLLLSYNWASLDWSLANSIRPRCAHIHHEDGFNADESERQLARRILYRRLALWRNDLLIVPSHNLQRIARDIWKRPAAKVRLIPNGIDWRRFAPSEPPAPPDGGHTIVLGTVAPLRAEKNIAALLRLASELRRRHALEVCIVGDGPERPRLEALAKQLGLDDICHFLGLCHDVASALAPLDIFLMPSLTEQMPISLLQAMAAAKPIAAYDVGDIFRIVSADNAPYIVPCNDEAAIIECTEKLIVEAPARRKIGGSNLSRVKEQYSESEMIERYEACYLNTLAIRG